MTCWDCKTQEATEATQLCQGCIDADLAQRKAWWQRWDTLQRTLQVIHTTA